MGVYLLSVVLITVFSLRLRPYETTCWLPFVKIIDLESGSRVGAATREGRLDSSSEASVVEVRVSAVPDTNTTKVGDTPALDSRDSRLDLIGGLDTITSSTSGTGDTEEQLGRRADSLELLGPRVEGILEGRATNTLFTGIVELHVDPVEVRQDGIRDGGGGVVGVGGVVGGHGVGADVVRLAGAVTHLAAEFLDEIDVVASVLGFVVNVETVEDDILTEGAEVFGTGTAEEEIPDVVSRLDGLGRAGEGRVAVSGVTTEGDHDLGSLTLAGSDLVSQTLTIGASNGTVE